MELLTEKYQDKIQGVLSCYDRMIILGTLPGICFSGGMSAYLTSHNIRIFDYEKFAKGLRDYLVANTEKIAKDEGVEIEYIQKKKCRKEDRIAGIITKRGDHPGLVHIFSCLESCMSYKPWHDKKKNLNYLRYDTGKCLHYYFYFIDKQLGLCFMRVSTWCPFRVEIYCNGHNILASELRSKDISFDLIDNVFISISDFSKAQICSDSLRIELLHKIFNRLADKYCPVIKKFDLQYHWSIMQVEYATDVVFKKQSDLKSMYEILIRTAIHAVKPDNIATFLGKKLTANFQNNIGNNFETRINGTRIKHIMGPVSIKMYDKLGLILRIETTVNDVTFFRHYRKVKHRNGNKELQYGRMRKGIYNLAPLAKLLRCANLRYIEFISTIDDDRTTAIKNLFTVSKTTKDANHSYKGLNFFDDDDLTLLLSIQRGEFNISGFQNKNLQSHLPNKNSSQISRLLKRIRCHGLIKKIKNTYKYYITSLGRRVIALGLKLRELFIIPHLSLSYPYCNY